MVWVWFAPDTSLQPRVDPAQGLGQSVSCKKNYESVGREILYLGSVDGCTDRLYGNVKQKS